MAEESEPGITFELQGAKVQLVEPPNQAVVYSNFCTVNVTSEELFFNFAIRSSVEQAIGVVKVFTSLAAAKRLSAALDTAIKQHEKIFGEIDIDRMAHLPADILANLKDASTKNDGKNDS